MKFSIKLPMAKNKSKFASACKWVLSSYGHIASKAYQYFMLPNIQVLEKVSEQLPPLLRKSTKLGLFLIDAVSELAMSAVDVALVQFTGGSFGIIFVNSLDALYTTQAAVQSIKSSARQWKNKSSSFSDRIASSADALYKSASAVSHAVVALKYGKRIASPPEPCRTNVRAQRIPVPAPKSHCLAHMPYPQVAQVSVKYSSCGAAPSALPTEVAFNQLSLGCYIARHSGEKSLRVRPLLSGNEARLVQEYSSSIGSTLTDSGIELCCTSSRPLRFSTTGTSSCELTSSPLLLERPSHITDPLSGKCPTRTVPSAVTTRHTAKCKTFDHRSIEQAKDFSAIDTAERIMTEGYMLSRDSIAQGFITTPPAILQTTSQSYNNAGETTFYVDTHIQACTPIQLFRACRLMALNAADAFFRRKIATAKPRQVLQRENLAEEGKGKSYFLPKY